MVQYISNIIKMIGHRQWYYLAILSAFTFMGSGDAYHYEIEAPAPVPTEQSFCLTLLDNSLVIDQDLNGSAPVKTLPSRWLNSGRFSDFVHAQNQHLQTAFNSLSKHRVDKPATRIFPKKIPITEEKIQMSNL